MCLGRRVELARIDTVIFYREVVLALSYSESQADLGDEMAGSYSQSRQEQVSAVC